MWIRNQHKDNLIDVKCLYIKVYNHDIEPFAIVDKNYDVQLGGYKTKERAIEVLDEIQHNMDEKIYPLVYQMPEK